MSGMQLEVFFLLLAAAPLTACPPNWGRLVTQAPEAPHQGLLGLSSSKDRVLFRGPTAAYCLV